MRCYQCDQVASGLFPIMKETGKPKGKCVPITIYVCANCHKMLMKSLREEGKK